MKCGFLEVHNMAIKPSLRFAMLLLLFHLIAAIVVYATAMSLVGRLAVILIILWSLLYYLARDILLILPDSWCDIALDQSNTSVVFKGGSSCHGKIGNKTIVSPYFVVLRIRFDNCRLPVSRVIFPDALGTGAFRDLCVRLKYS
jgi:toxin CptA